MASKEAVKLKKGDFVEYEGDIWAIAKTDFYNPGKGSALMKVKIRHPQSGKVIDHTYKSNEQVEMAEVSGSEMQFLYNDGTNLAFMDNQNFEQYELPVEIVAESAGYLKEGENYYVYVHNEIPLNINLGGSVSLEVTQAEEVVKGNTTGNLKKEVTLETGAKIMVPGFIKIGDVVSINPETGEYRGRVNE